VQWRAKVSAIHMTAKARFERLYLVSGLGTLGPFVTMPSAPTFPPLALRLFLDLCAIFSRVAPQFFCQQNSPNNLAESLPELRFDGIQIKKSVVLYAAMGGMSDRTTHAKCKQHTTHVLSASIAQAFNFGSNTKKFSYSNCIRYYFNDPFMNLCSYRESTFGRGEDTGTAY